MREPLRLLVEGWRFLQHSHGLLNHCQLDELCRRPGIELRHRDVPFLMTHWRAVRGLFDAASEARVGAIAAPETGWTPQAVLRMGIPLDLRPLPGSRVYAFTATEFGILRKPLLRLMGVPSLAEPMRSSNVDLLTCSHWSAQGLVRSGADPARVKVVALGADTSVYRPLPAQERAALRAKLGLGDEFVFLNIGAMTRNKGVVPLLRAFAALLEQHPQARLVLKGSDKLYGSRETVRKIAAEALQGAEAARVAERIRYIGDELPGTEMAKLYQSADAYVSPYLAEGFNLPVLEAMACGLPVICTEGGSTDDFVSDDCALRIRSALSTAEMDGETVHFHNPDATHLVACMHEAIVSDALRARALHAGPRHVAAGYTWAHWVDGVLKLLDAPA